MTQQQRNTRRAMIVRRWTAYRVGAAQREIWRKRRANAAVDTVDEDAGMSNDPLEELPDSLLG